MPAGKRTGYASLPLHGGKAPAWLFSRMVLLSREILTHIVEEYGAREVLRRMSDPFWFQAFGCVLGFDWHSSGVTTTVCGAVKESLRETGPEWGLFAAGGKGAASKKSPLQIADVCDRLGRDPDRLVHASRTAAKVEQRRRTGWLSALSPRLLVHLVRRLVRRATGHGPSDVDGEAVPLAVGAHHQLRGRTARCCLLRRAGRHVEPRGERERRREARQRRARELTARHVALKRLAAFQGS